MSCGSPDQIAEYVNTRVPFDITPLSQRRGLWFWGVKDIFTILIEGEFEVDVSAVRKYGVSILCALNRTIPRG